MKDVFYLGGALFFFFLRLCCCLGKNGSFSDFHNRKRTPEARAKSHDSKSALLIRSRRRAEAVNMSPGRVFPTSVRQTECDQSRLHRLPYLVFRDNIPKVHQCFHLGVISHRSILQDTQPAHSQTGVSSTPTHYRLGFFLFPDELKVQQSHHVVNRGLNMLSCAAPVSYG